MENHTHDRRLSTTHIDPFIKYQELRLVLGEEEYKDSRRRRRVEPQHQRNPVGGDRSPHKPVHIKYGPSELKLNPDDKIEAAELQLEMMASAKKENGYLNLEPSTSGTEGAMADKPKVKRWSKKNSSDKKTSKSKQQKPIVANGAIATDTEEFGNVYDEARIKSDDKILKDLEMKDFQLVVATPTVGKSLIGFSLCSNCNGFAKPPISCCDIYGHILCDHCTRNEGIEDCPKMIPGTRKQLERCGAKIVSCPLQLYKHYFDTNIFYCPYKDNGCPDQYPGGAIGRHIDLCEYRPSVICPFSICTVGMIETQYFYMHLKNEHGVPFFDINSTLVRVKHERKALISNLTRDFRWIGAFLQAADLDFMLIIQETKHELLIWVQLYTKSQLLRGRMFVTRLALKIPGSVRELEWSGKVLSSETGMDAFSKSNQSMIIQKKSFERYFMYRGDDEDDDNLYFNIDVQIDQVLSTGTDKSGTSTGHGAADIKSQEGTCKDWTEKVRERLGNMKVAYLHSAWNEDGFIFNE